MGQEEENALLVNNPDKTCEILDKNKKEQAESLRVKIERGIYWDDRIQFRSFLRRQPTNGEYIPFPLDQVFNLICLNNAVKCASDLLEFEFDTHWRVDVNAPLEGGFTPLQMAAHRLSYPMIQLLLLHGAHPNNLPAAHPVGPDAEKLPLYLALQTLRKQFLGDWSPEKSVFKLLYILCLKELREPLAAVKLLASRTEHRYLEMISKHCLEKGEIHQLGTLLQVSWHALVNPSADRKGLEACQIAQCISDELESVSLSDTQRRTELESAQKMLTVMEKARDKLEYYRDITVGMEPHHLPFKVGSFLSFEAKIPMMPEDVYSDDVNCLMPKISATHKALLDKEIQEHTESAMTTLSVASKNHGTPSMLFSRSFHTSQALETNFVVDPESQLDDVVPSKLVCEYDEIKNKVVESTDSIKCMRNDDDIMDLEPRMKEVLENDKKDEFVNLMNTLPCDDDAVDFLIFDMFDYDAVKCAKAILNGEITDPDGKFHLQSFFSRYFSTPLNEAVARDAFRITALLLDHGHDANARSSPWDGKEGLLPLQEALLRIWNDNSWVHSRPSKSAFKLLAILCGSAYKVKRLENVRLLAKHTKDLQLEIDNYLKNKKMIELGALMLLGYKPSSTHISLLKLEGKEPVDKSLLQLVEVFDTIGTKLEAYIKLQQLNPRSQEKVVLEMYSLFKDAGLHVTSKDIPIQDCEIYFERLDDDGRKTALPWHVQHGFMPIRTYHSCVTTKAHGSSFSNQRQRTSVYVPRAQNWRSYNRVLSYLRRGIRYL